MSTQNPIETWAASLQSLDKQACLYPAEIDSLAAWAFNQSISPHSLFSQSINWQPLARLLEPVKRVFTHYGSDKPDEVEMQACCHLILYEMHRRQTAFWAWDETTWLDMIALTKSAFVIKHKLRRHQPRLKPATVRLYLMRCAYLLKEVPVYALVPIRQPVVAATSIFGATALQAALSTVKTELARSGWSTEGCTEALASSIGQALLHNRNPNLEDLTFSAVELVYQQLYRYPSLRRACILLSKALHSLAILPQPLIASRQLNVVRLGQADTLPAVWFDLIENWAAVADCSEGLRNTVRFHAAKAGRYSATLPGVPGPAQWDKTITMQFVSAVKKMNKGEWAHPRLATRYNPIDQEVKPASQALCLNCLRRFFTDCQEWGWIPKLFIAQRYLATPRSISRLCGVKPRAIEEEKWGKLLMASLSLTPEDLSGTTAKLASGQILRRKAHYPFLMERAIAVTWLLAGLRSNEIARLAVGCIRQVPVTKGYSALLEKGAVRGACYLRVPAHKTGKPFDKAIAQEVGETIMTWEKVRPPSPARQDKKTREQTHFLFQWRGGNLGPTYINARLIPALCRKAGIDTSDRHGPITSHRARATIATQMYLSGEMGLLDLQKWFAHKSLRTTLYYLDVPDDKLLQAFMKANGYVIDQAKRLGQTTLPASESVTPEAMFKHLASSRAHLLASISSLEKLCTTATLTETDRRTFQENLAALRLLAQQLPPEPEV
ncbi:tyrosine-type recombinase/integrase [Hymenobacter sp. GOD-10R]|uniref:tyrosine-type recombinase/integrase n=1 Tax=Hymenobacter sp. GOD-10R TaxID=3093922 RepID=UPI002D788C2E|nr:tyrosine-type recombinase/integrase [Hymenobacter sp. GOD-10R]WRQ31900.1 tyrosine-type recombinase/integrase [Hymenobacter sp. GOD-10R]